MLAKILIELGLTYRSVCLLFVFVTIFIIGSLCTLIIATNHYYIKWAIILIPLVIIDIILGIATLGSSSKKEFNICKKERQYQHDNLNKFKIAMACHACYGLIFLFIVILIIVFDWFDYGFEILVPYVFFGWIIVYKIMWPFFKKNMK